VQETGSKVHLSFFIKLQASLFEILEWFSMGKLLCHGPDHRPSRLISWLEVFLDSGILHDALSLIGNLAMLASYHQVLIPRFQRTLFPS
jgi:hypothetical protein